VGIAEIKRGFSLARRTCKKSYARRMPTPSISINRQRPEGDSIICLGALSAKEIALESKLFRRRRVCDDRSLLCECSDAGAPNYSRLARNAGKVQFTRDGGEAQFTGNAGEAELARNCRQAEFARHAGKAEFPWNTG
jgi:hypothetical protein